MAAGPYAEWMRDEDVTAGLVLRNPPNGTEALVSYIEKMNNSPDNYLLAIVVKETGEHVGNIKLGPIDRVNKRAEIGLLIGAKRLWGRGYGSEAIDAVADFAFRVVGLHRVSAGCYESNIASLNAFKRAGFKVEGVLRDHWRLEGRWEDNYVMGRVFTRARDRA